MIILNVEDVETPLYPGQYYIYAYSIISCDSWLDAWMTPNLVVVT